MTEPQPTQPEPTPAPRPARAQRAVVRLATGAVLVTGAALAGIATTAVWPTTVTTRQYAASARLSADPGEASTVHSPTVFGDLDLSFGSALPAPGIDVGLQVRDTITTTLARSGLDIRSLMPSSAEIDHAVTTAAWQVAAKVLLGVALAMLLAAFLLRGTPVGAWVPVVSGVVAVALFAGTLYGAYGRGGTRSVRTTGLLTAVRANTGLLGDVEKRSAEVTPYVRNVLALATAVQERYTPAEVSGPAAVKIVAVSDIHGQNQYPLLKSLVQQEKASAVIDSGDLVNFGSVKEADAAGLFTGIASLGVPYFFVRGNHDANSPTDDALVQRLRTIPNVVVLEPQRERQYTFASVGGLRLAGFGDPRWFGDGGQNTGEMQKPSIAAFRAAVEAVRAGKATTDLPAAVQKDPVDVIVGHEPSAVEGMEDLAPLRVHGHQHSQDLQGSRIQLGTFTGGGVFSHYIVSNDGSELAGQPYAFDVLSFGPTCALTTLARYRFTGLVEGRPTYDNVQVLNGASIETKPPTGRTCSATEPLERYSVSVPPADVPTATPTPSVTPSLPGGRPTPTATETPTPTRTP